VAVERQPEGGMPTATVARGRSPARGSIRDRFNEVSRRLTDAVGAPPALGLAVGVVILWALTGPIFGFSDTWQLAMNTTSSIITFCMVFVIQASQNRDSKAIQLKLDEIIRSTNGARNELIDLEVAPEERVNQTEEELMRVATGEADTTRSATATGHASAADDPGAAGA